MFEKERAEIRILSNIADAQGLGHARDLLRKAEYEFKQKSDLLHSLAAECTPNVPQADSDRPSPQRTPCKNAAMLRVSSLSAGAERILSPERLPFRHSASLSWQRLTSSA
jgi:hypothetical protein